MKRISLILKILLGLIFTVFGANYFFWFLPAPPPVPGPATDLGIIMANSHWMTVVKVIEIACGLMLLANFYAPLALILITPVTVNIVLFHMLLHPEGLPIAIIVLVINVVLLFLHKNHYKGFLSAK
ncbi:MAG: hypothetical protein KF690_10530 [Bacteroidetes bacterium]|nr:hypothetical protein [Bacteroidota bacterium]